MNRPPRGCRFTTLAAAAVLCVAATTFAAGAAPFAIRRSLGSTFYTLPNSYQPLPFANTDFNAGFPPPASSNVIAAAPVSGFYELSGALTTTASFLGDGYVAVNGAPVDRFYQHFLNGQFWEEIPLSGAYQLSAGDVVSVVMESQSGPGQVAAVDFTRVSLSHRDDAAASAAMRRGPATFQTLTSVYQPIQFSDTVPPLVTGGASTPPPAGALAVAPRAGVYSLKGALTALGAANGAITDGYVAVNGVPVDRFYQQYTNSAWEEIGLDGSFKLQAGDVVSVYARTNTGTGQIADGNFTQLSLVEDSPYSRASRRSMSAFQNISTGSGYQPVAFDVTDFNADAGGLAVGAGTGTIGIASAAGFYDVSGMLTAYSTNSVLDGYLAVNGVPVDRFYQQYPVLGQWEEIPFSSLLQLNPGDVVSLYVQSTGQIAGQDFTRASITLVPEPAGVGLLAVTGTGLLGRRRGAADGRRKS